MKNLILFISHFSPYFRKIITNFQEEIENISHHKIKFDDIHLITVGSQVIKTS